MKDDRKHGLLKLTNPHLTYKHNPNYADVEYLHIHGHWPNKEIPPWAVERARLNGVTPGMNFIAMEAMRYEIHNLRHIITQIERVTWS
jgi:hypothetical protein